jgi:Ni/Co efflux regulator RcnB
MRNVLIAALAATALVPSVGSAQTIREVRHDQREVRRDVARGNYREARRDRRETREDWRDYRRTHRSVYRRPAYYAPRGYRYRRVGIGFTLARPFWARNYWVDYNTYRLPPPPPGTTYVRYGNDVLLISMRTGRVIAAYDDFFW